MFRDKKGMTLLEVMIALMIFLITFMALLQSIVLAINTNVINELRDAAVNVAELRMSELRNTPFSDPDMQSTAGLAIQDPDITRTVRSFTCSYTPRRTITPVNANTRQVTLAITWTYRGVNYQHNVSTVMREQ